MKLTDEYTIIAGLAIVGAVAVSVAGGPVTLSMGLVALAGTVAGRGK